MNDTCPKCGAKLIGNVCPECITGTDKKSNIKLYNIPAILGFVFTTICAIAIFLYLINKKNPNEMIVPIIYMSLVLDIIFTLIGILISKSCINQYKAISVAVSIMTVLEIGLAYYIFVTYEPPKKTDECNGAWCHQLNTTIDWNSD